ncbi:MAG: hypothetical protein ABSG54_02830 [Terriglobia bacterium]
MGADVTGDFAEGSVAVYFSGTIMPLAGQLTMTNPARSLILESEMVDNAPGLGLLPKELHALWWGIAAGRDGRVMISNTSPEAVTADVFLDFLGERHTSAPLTLRPHETKVVSITSLLTDLKVSPASAPEGGITIIPRGTTPALTAQGKITDVGRGFSTSLNFPDPALQKSNALHASGVPIGIPTEDSPYARTGVFIPQVIVRNLVGSPQIVTLTVEYPGKDGPAQALLAPFSVGAYSTVDVSLDSVFGLLPLPLPFCSIRIQYSGAPGSALAEVTSIEQGGDLVIDSRLANEGDGMAGGGAHPWHLDEQTESILFLTDMGDKPARIGFQAQAGGVHYYLNDLKLSPHETRVINLRKLRDAQKEDFQGSKIPADAADGSVVWIRLDKVPVMGRLVVLQRHRAMASNYDCGIGCQCPANFTAVSVAPAAWAMLVNDLKPFLSNEVDTDCNNANFYYDVTTGAGWLSNFVSVATVDNLLHKGQVKGQGGGSAGISADWTSIRYTLNHITDQCDETAVGKRGNGTDNVCSLSIASPSSGAIINLGGANYNQATVPLQATSACSGTANWTLNYTYTSRQPATYTGSSTTSNTIGQTLNYSTPVGRGGQVTAQAQATLAGQTFTRSVTFYVLGTTIPNTTITNRLVSLYTTGATPHLLTGIAMDESAYQQFVQAYMMGGTGLWPNGTNSDPNLSVPLDAFVGLMQVPNAMNTAFDWVTNTSTGSGIFNQKLGSANNYVSSLQSQYPQLPGLTGVQLENEALVYYGGFATGTHYYYPNSTGTAWVTTTTSRVLNYVGTIRNDMQ